MRLLFHCLKGLGMDNGLLHYSVLDVSSNASAGVTGNRRLGPVGALVHSTSGLDSLSWLMGGSELAGHPASSDFLIRRDGIAYKISPPGRYAYHAGRSELTYINSKYLDDQVSQLLIGVELECLDSERPTFAQYDSLAQLVVSLGLDWGWRWPYTLLGHYAVARPLGRRSDPVNYDWGSLMGRIYVRALHAQIPGLAPGS